MAGRYFGYAPRKGETDADMVDAASLSCHGDKRFFMNDLTKELRDFAKESKLPYFHVMHTR